MDILYSQKIDRQIREELNEMGPRLAPLFGFNFPKVQFSKSGAARAEKVVQEITGEIIDEERARGVLRQMYHADLPALAVYVNTTPFSTWNTENCYISISINRFPEKVFSSFCHEANHYMYDLVYKTEKYQDTAIKETVTVLNTVFDIQDYGWRVFEKERQVILEIYRSTKDFTKAIDYARKTIQADKVMQ